MVKMVINYRNKDDNKMKMIIRWRSLHQQLLVSSLNGVCESFEVDEEIFSIGASSCIIADELSTLSWKDNRKVMGGGWVVAGW